MDEVARRELDLLEGQLERMRGMLFGYSALFFSTIRNWTVICFAALALGWSGLVPAAVAIVPFAVPFAFLETGYQFWYTIFARRHAERLEQAINQRLGRDVLVAHRLEAAFFYPPDAPKLAALSAGNVGGYMSLMTLGYAAGALLLWVAGFVSTLTFGDLASADVHQAGGNPTALMGLIAPLQVAWTVIIIGIIAWLHLGRRDENRLVVALDRAYRSPVPPAAESDAPAALATEPMEAPTS